MAYQTGAASNVENLLFAWFDFLTGLTPAWTENGTRGDNYITMEKGNLFVTYRWDWDATPSENFRIYQSTAYAGATEPHNQANDSGSGDSSSALSHRHVDFETTGTFTYYFFARETTPFTAYAVVETSDNRFRHFGCGDDINRVNDWTGGAFAYGQYVDQSSEGIDDPSYLQHSFLLDGAEFSSLRGGTMRCEGLPGEGGSSKWGVFSNVAPGNDRQGTPQPRVHLVASTRSGGWSRALSFMRNSVLNTYKPLLPISLFYVNEADSPESVYYLGDMPDIAIVNMANYTNGQEITVGGDTYKVFPWVKKKIDQDDTEESWNAGVAYKKVA